MLTEIFRNTPRSSKLKWNHNDKLNNLNFLLELEVSVLNPSRFNAGHGGESAFLRNFLNRESK